MKGKNYVLCVVYQTQDDRNQVMQSAPMPYKEAQKTRKRFWSQKAWIEPFQPATGFAG